MIPGAYKIESFVEGDGWGGIPSLTIKVNGVTPASPIESAEILMCLNNEVEPSTAVEISTANEKLTLVSAEGWELSAPDAVEAGLIEGEWLMQIKIKPVGGILKTYISDTFKVLKTVKKPA
ncbi:MAG: hypothetical protein Q8Q59_06295 [Luteolibacter sp.]|jgi:hypothetical protein|nr:hypothetical protein [Luteolibacter sp.]